MVGEKYCIDNSKFKSIISAEAYIHLNDSDSIPHSIGEEHLTLGGWKFKTASTVFCTAKAPEIIEGWNILVNDTIPMDALFLSCFSRAISESNIPRIDVIEPDLLGLVRMCYWYYKCSNLPDECDFVYKKQEMQEKLAGDLPNKIKKWRIRVNYNDISNFKDKLKNVLEELRKKNPEQLYSRTQEISNTIFDCTAELMYGFLSSQSKNVSFQRNLPIEKKADLFIEGIDAEIKNINDTINEKLEYKKEKMRGTIDLRDVFNRF